MGNQTITVLIIRILFLVYSYDIRLEKMCAHWAHTYENSAPGPENVGAGLKILRMGLEVSIPK